MTNVVNKYAEFISKQLVREGKIDLVEQENEAVRAKVAKHFGIPASEADHALSHVASHGNHHTYSAGESHWTYDGEPAEHSTHDASTGKTHDFSLPPKKMGVKAIHAVMNKAVPGGVSAEHAKAVASEHNDGDM